MKFNLKSLNGKIVWLLTVLLFSTFYIFESYTWGKYMFLAVTIVVFFLTAFEERGIYRCSIGKFHFFIMCFIVFTFCSSLWAISSSDALQKGITITEILICMAVLYNYYIKYNSVSPLLSALKWSSYVITCYSLYFYGIDFIRSMVQGGVRIENSYTNINSIGMLAAIGIIIQIDEILKKRKFLIPVFFCIPSIYMIAATQSRKAFVMLVVGIFMVLVLRNIDNKSALKTIFRVTAVIIIFLLAIQFITTLPMFEGVNQRMADLIVMVTGQGKMGASASTRDAMVKIGIEQFHKTPILGMGIGCPHYLAAEQLNLDAYLHNNYVELLAAGGIVGFIIYYAMYFFLIKNIWVYRHFASSELVIVFVLVVLFLVMDYGMVSAYSKSTYFYFMIFFLEIEKLKNNYFQQSLGKLKSVTNEE